MPKINPYFRVQGPGRPISQFVEEKLPAELIMSNLKGRQAKQDQIQGAMDELALWNERAITNRDKALVNQLKGEVDAFGEEWFQKDLTTGEAARGLRNLSKKLRDDPRLKIVKQHVAYDDAMREAKKKAGAKFFGARERRWNEQKARYDATGEITTDEMMREILGVETLDWRAKAKTYFDDMPDVSRDWFKKASVGQLDSWVKYGSKGVSDKRIDEYMQRSVYDFSISPEGQQLKEQYQDEMIARGMQPSVEGERAYVRKFLLDVGMEQSGMSYSKDVASGLNTLSREKSDDFIHSVTRAGEDVSVNYKDYSEKYGEAWQGFTVAEKKLEQFEANNPDRDNWTEKQQLTFNALDTERIKHKSNLFFASKTKKRVEEKMMKDKRFVFNDINNEQYPDIVNTEKMKEAIRGGGTFADYFNSLTKEEKVKELGGKSLESLGLQEDPSSLAGDAVDVIANVLAITTPYTGGLLQTSSERQKPSKAERFNTFKNRYRKSFNEVAEKYAQPISTFHTKNKVVKSVENAVNDALKTGAIDFTTVQGLSAADNETLEKVNDFKDARVSTTDINMGGKHVFRMSFTNKDDKTDYVNITLAGNSQDKYISGKFADELIKEGTSANDRKLVEQGHYFKAYKTPASYTSQKIAAVGSIGQQLELQEINMTNDGESSILATPLGIVTVETLDINGKNQYKIMLKDGTNIVKEVYGSNNPTVKNEKEVLATLSMYIQAKKLEASK